MDKNRQNLLYRPELAPEKRYKSDADFEHGVDNDIPNLPVDEEKKVDDSPARIREDLEEIQSLIKSLPENVHFWGKSVEKLKTRTKVEWPNGTTPIPPKKEYDPPVKKYRKDISHIGHLPQEQNPKLVNMPSLFPATLPIQLKLETPKTLVQIIQDGYTRDQIQLEQNYLQQLQLIMQKYFQQMIATMADCGLSDINQLTEDFDGNYVKVPRGKGLEHLRDEIVRSQIIRNQKARLFKKTHAVDNTLMHLRSWHAAEKQRERYYTEKYRDSGTYVESHSNAILRQSRSNYDKNYSSALYDMYRYLNSSALLTNDILEMTVKEAQAKAMLLKSGVNIFEKEPITLSAEAGGIAGNSGQAGDGRGSGFDSAATPENKTENNSGTKAPNGTNYDKNDIDYLTNQGYSKEDVIATLSKDKKYAGSSTTENKKGIFNNLPDEVMRGVGGGFGGGMNKKSSIFDNLPDEIKKGAGRGIGGGLNRNSSESNNGLFGGIGNRIYNSSGNSLLGAIAGSYLQNKIDKGFNVGDISINRNGIKYKNVSYDGTAVKYGNVTYDGKINREKIVETLKEGGLINNNVAKIAGIENKAQAIEYIQKKLQKYIAEQEQLEKKIKTGDESAKKLSEETAEKCRQLLLNYKKISSGEG